MVELAEKKERLIQILQGYDSVLVAFSGGVDSTLLLKAAHQALGKNVLAVTAASEINPPGEAEEAEDLARLIGVEHTVMRALGLKNLAIALNGNDRCYHCKKEIYSALQDYARQRGLNRVVDGVNADDVEDFRPGIRAGMEMGIHSPLKEAGFTKLDVRELSREFGLPTADRPANPCLASRFPYGTEITIEGLRMVAQAEEYITSIGIPQLRVRHHGNMARIEVPPVFLKTIVDRAVEVDARLKEIGYSYISLDLRGYRTGAMNETLEEYSRSAGFLAWEARPQKASLLQVKQAASEMLDKILKR